MLMLYNGQANAQAILYSRSIRANVFVGYELLLKLLPMAILSSMSEYVSSGTMAQSF